MRATMLAVAALGVCVAVDARAGDVTGTVHFAGEAPALAPIKTTRDGNVCGATEPNETVEVAGGHLKNVVVTVSGATGAKPQAAKVTLDQKTCRYHPHVQAIPVGSTLEIINSDPVLHNIHGYLGNQTVFNLAMPIKDQRIPKKLTKPGVVKVKCDIHAWMSAWVVVADGPSAVDGDDGTYTIKDVPAGTYTLTAWHETLGTKTAQVTVPASGNATSDFTYGK